MKLPSKTIFWFLVFLLLGLALIFFDQLGWLDWWQRLTQPTLASLYSSTSQLKTRVNPFHWSNRFCPDQSNLVKELEEERARLVSRLVKLDSCQEELRASRRLLGAPLPDNWQFLPVKIFKTQEAYFIDAGRQAGVKEGLPLLWENVYLGKVVEVKEQVARVELAVEKGSKTAVKIRSEKGVGAKGILYGQGGIQAEVGRILIQEEVNQGDTVITAGEIEVPPDLAIGQIQKVIQEKNEIYQKAEVTMLVDPEKLETVFLLTKK
jgi:cell shape-determining protein MreC